MNLGCCRRWKGGKPEETDLISFQNLLAAVPKGVGVKRVVFTSSAGVERQGTFPYLVLNLFGATSQKTIRSVHAEPLWRCRTTSSCAAFMRISMWH